MTREFEINKTYKTSSTNMYTKNEKITVIKRTEKTITTEYYGRIKIKIDNEGNEYIDLKTNPFIIEFHSKNNIV